MYTALFFIKFWFKSEHDLKTMDKGIVPRGIRLAARTIGRKAGAGGLVVIDAALRVLPALHAYKVRHKAGHIALEEGIVAQHYVLLTAAGFIQLGSHYKEGLRVRREVVSPTDTPPRDNVLVEIMLRNRLGQLFASYKKEPIIPLHS